MSPWLLVGVFCSWCRIALGQAASTDVDAWSTTVDIAGRQRMLSQRMAKEFFFVANGFEVDENKANLQDSIALFDSSLQQLRIGDPSAGVLGPPTERTDSAFQAVSVQWASFRQLLEDKVDVIRYEDGPTKTEVLHQIAADCMLLLEVSAVAVSRLVDAAAASGAAKAGLVVDVAGRQRMLIQKMAKEQLLVALGVSIAENVQNLKGTLQLFDDSHLGIIRGAEWAGVPPLTQMCTLEAMSDVTYSWTFFKPIVTATVVAQSPPEACELAFQHLNETSSRSSELFGTMVEAVKLFVKDEGGCSDLSKIDPVQWTYLLNNIGKQRFLGQQATALFAFISNGINVETSRLNLIINLADTSAHLRLMIEGNRAQSIPSPPTQQTADQLLAASMTWSELSAVLDSSVRRGVNDPVTVRLVARLSKRLLEQMDEAVQLYVSSCESSNSSVPAYVIDIAGRQRMLFQKMSKEASLLAYATETDEAADLSSNWEDLNATRDLFTLTHRRLLDGDTSAGIARATHICIVQQMKTVADKFGELEAVALDVANGRRERIENMLELNPVAFTAMNTAVGWYAGAAPSCDPLQVTFDEWLSALMEVGSLRALGEKLAHAYLMASNVGGERSKFLVEAKVELEASLRTLTYGSGKVPPPPDQAILDFWRSFADDRAEPFLHALDGNSTSAVLSFAELFVEGAEQAMSLYVSAAEQAKVKVPTARVDIASRQVLLAQRMVKIELLIRFDLPSADEIALAEATSAFERGQELLLNGGRGIQATIPERSDLLRQWDVVMARYQSLKAQLQGLSERGIPTSSVGDSALLLSAMDALEEKLVLALALYGILDPYVPPAESSFPWMPIVYASMALYILGAVGLGWYWSFERKKKTERSRFDDFERHAATMHGGEGAGADEMAIGEDIA